MSMKNNPRKALTLIEITIAVALSTIVGLAVFTLYSGGVKSSVSGVVNLEMLGEGRKIVAQIRDDLKNSCIPYHGAFSLSFNDLLQIDFSRERGLEGAEFSLLRFRYEPEFVKTGLPGPDYLLRPLLGVRYRLEAVKDSNLLRLIRETDHGTDKARQKILSERISFLNISPVSISGPANAENWFWNISLSLSQHTDRIGVDKNGNGSQARGAASLEFYDLVASDFFNAINNFRHSPRNWHTGLRYAPD